MKSLQKWGVVFWLVVLLCVPWSMAEAGRPVYLSDYLVVDKNLTSQWILTQGGVDFLAYDNWDQYWPAIRITLASDGPVFSFTYHRGQVQFDSDLSEEYPLDPNNPNSPYTQFIYDFPDDATFGVERPLFSYTIGIDGLVTFTNVLENSIAGCVPLDDRQPTDKLISLNPDSTPNKYAMQLDLPKRTFSSSTHYCLQINFMDISNWDGDRKNIPAPFCELHMSDDLNDPGTMACTIDGLFYECVDTF